MTKMPDERPATSQPRRGDRSPQILRAVLRLREMILTGALPPGRRVAELRVVDAIGVSRTPLRLAMETLEHEGLLERRPAGGFVVREFTLRDVEHAIELRGTLEGVACRFAAERDPGCDTAPLAAIVDAIDDVLDAEGPSSSIFDRYVELNRQFHQTVIELASNALVRRLLDQVLALPFASPSAFVHAHSTSRESFRVLVAAQEHHRSITQAIAAGDGARADMLAREHAHLALRNLHVATRDRERFRSLPGGALVRLA